ALLGVPGVLVAALIVSFWAAVFVKSSRWRITSRVCLLILLFLCVAYSLLLSDAPRARNAALRAQCANNLKQIAIALHTYHGIHQTLPPAYTVDANGRRMHSWRVLLLPALGRMDLYDRYHLDEPWDGPHNRQLHSEIVEQYRCPAARQSAAGATHTNYVAVIGPGTVWPGAESIAFRDIADGTAYTMMIVESDSEHIHWMEPRDLDVEQAVRLLGSAEWNDAVHVREDLWYREIVGRHIVLADRGLRFIPRISEEAADQLIGIDNGYVGLGMLDAYALPVARKLRYGNVVRLSVFLLLVFLPV
ncbi:MAG: DUF1559 domain-containing protein, partial [Planctomycetales bacterium]|nr:DUF1559 domain-containing protein [Planctomycetales bacterium]